MTFFERLLDAFEKYELRYTIVGGYALALHGAPRGTIDIDCIIEHTEEDFVKCEKALLSIGLEPRLPVQAKEVFYFREEYIAKKNLIAWGFINPLNPMECVDIIITQNLKNTRTQSYRFGLKKVSVIAREDLIMMKKKSARPQDLEDIKALELIIERKKSK